MRLLEAAVLQTKVVLLAMVLAVPLGALAGVGLAKLSGDPNLSNGVASGAVVGPVLVMVFDGPLGFVFRWLARSPAWWLVLPIALLRVIFALPAVWLASFLVGRGAAEPPTRGAPEGCPFAGAVFALDAVRLLGRDFTGGDHLFDIERDWSLRRDARPIGRADATGVLHLELPALGGSTALGRLAADRLVIDGRAVGELRPG